MHGHTIQSILDQPRILVAADRFGGKGTSANAGAVPGRNATRRVPAPSTLARGLRATRGNYCPRISRARAPGEVSLLRRYPLGFGPEAAAFSARSCAAAHQGRRPVAWIPN